LQVNLEREAMNLRRFAENFKDSSSVTVPKPILVKESILVETFEPGVSIQDYLSRPHPKNKRIAQIGIDAYMQMMLKDNFVHSDLHPGNILVRWDGSSPQLVLLDVGLTTELTPKDKKNFTALFGAVVRRDGRYGASLMIHYAREVQCSLEEQEEFKEEMGELFDKVASQKLSEIDVGLLMNNVLALVQKYKIRIESNFATLVMGTIILEGLGKQLDPDLDILTASIPYLVRTDSMYLLRQFLGRWFPLLFPPRSVEDIPTG